MVMTGTDAVLRARAPSGFGGRAPTSIGPRSSREHGIRARWCPGVSANRLGRRLQQVPTKNRVIRDPLYGYISLPGPLAAIIDHPLYQRLRRVGQTSMTSAVYPTANGTRFEHGLGAMHLAARGLRAAWGNAGAEAQKAFLGAVQADDAIPREIAAKPDAVVDLLVLAVGAAALLHDIGHPPFSHVLEPLYASLAVDHFEDSPELAEEWTLSGCPYHEFVGLLMAAQITRDLRPEPLGAVTMRVLRADENGRKWADVLHSIVAGEVDVDRLDYVMRDAQKAGTEFGAIDYARLVDALELHVTSSGFRIAPGVRARSAVETLLLQRTQAYKWITYHPKVVGSNTALSRAMEALLDLTRSEGTFMAVGQRQAAGPVFASVWPNLNYVRPVHADLRRILSMLTSAPRDGEGEAQLSLGEQLGELLIPLTEKLRVDLQASIDDSVIVESLKSASLVAQVLLDSGAPDADLRDQLSRLLTFQQHALYRLQNCLAAWKTVEEFAKASRRMVAKLSDAVRAAYDDVIRRHEFKDHPAALRGLEGDRDDVLRWLADDPVIGVNRLVTTLFDGEPTYLRDFAGMLTIECPRLNGAPGHWELAYTGFTSVKQDDEAAVLFDGEEPQKLYESSKLARALGDVEASRFRLCAFFFVTYPGLIQVSEEVDRRELRAMLMGEFMAAFPVFVEQRLPAIVTDEFFSERQSDY